MANTAIQLPITRKYGVTEQKKAELDDLIIKVRNAEDEVVESQSVVSSLSAKLDKFNNELVIAKNNKELGLANKRLMDELVLISSDMKKDSAKVLGNMQKSEKKVKDAAARMGSLIDELIYTAELVNKLSGLISRKRESNPLISEVLVKKVTQAGTDANNAVALTLTALQAIFTSQATNIEGQNVLKLSNKFAIDLNSMIEFKQKDKDTYDGLEAFEVTQAAESFMNISDMILQAYRDYEAIYDSTLIATEDTKTQLSEAELALEDANVTLNSLKASLAAAQAAALAA